MKPHLKLVLSAALALVGLMGRSQAQTTIYLVDLFNHTPYSGNAATDFGIAGTVTDVGFNGTGGLTSAGGTYTLGSATLTLNTFPSTGGPTGTSQHDGTNDYTASQWLTANDIWNDNTTNPITFTLTGLTVGDTVTISAMGGWSPNHGHPASIKVLDGSTVLGTGVASETTGDIYYDGLSTSDKAVTANQTTAQSEGGGTFGLDATFVATSDAYTIDFSPSSGEGELSSFEITEAGATPEPSTWAMMLGGAGVLGLVLRSRWRVRQV